MSTPNNILLVVRYSTIDPSCLRRSRINSSVRGSELWFITKGESWMVYLKMIRKKTERALSMYHR